MASSGITVQAGPDIVRTLPDVGLQELLKLQKAAQKISSILDLDKLIDKIVNDIACSFGCVELNIYLHEPERCELVLSGVHGCPVHCKRPPPRQRNLADHSLFFDLESMPLAIDLASTQPRQ